VTKSLRDEPIVVHIDPELEDLIPRFLGNVKKDVEDLRQSLGDSDFDELKISGHKIKGYGGGYGFPEITDIGRHIEDAADLNDEIELQKQIDQLSDYIKRVKPVYGKED